MKSLEGIKVCDFSHVMAGPFCSYMLALMGAEITHAFANQRGSKRGAAKP